MAKTCRGCIYRSTQIAGGSCCDYLLLTGKSRIVQGYTKGVQPGHRCPAYETQTAKLAEKKAKKKVLSIEQERLRLAQREIQRKRAADLRAAQQRQIEERNGKMLELYQAGKLDGEIGKAVGYSARTVAKWRQRRHLPSHASPKNIVSENEGKMIYLYDAGYSDGAIARVIGCSASVPQKWRKQTNRPANRPVRQAGSQSQLTRAKPNVLDDAATRELYRQGWNDRQIAEHFGCAQRTVCRWRHINNLPVNERRQHDE